MPSTSAVASAGPTNSETLLDIPISAFASWISGSGTVCGITAVDAGRKNASAVPNIASITTTCQICDLAGDDQRRQRGVEDEADQVGRDHQPVPGQPVRPDPADQHEADERNRMGGEDEAEVGRLAGQVDHEQGQRDGDDPVAEHARQPGQPEQSEVAMPEHVEETAHALIVSTDGGRAWSRGRPPSRRA